MYIIYIIYASMIQDERHWCQILISRVSHKSTLPRYQVLLFLNFGLKWLLAGMILFSLNFFYIVPQFNCDDKQPPPSTTCEQYICAMSQDEWYAHLTQPIPRSISLDYGIYMLCYNKWISSLLQSMSYIGSFVGYFVMSHIADNYGRKKTQFFSWIINIIGLCILVLSFNLFMVGIGSFLMGLGTNATITLHYTFLKQLLVGRMRQRSFIVLQVMFSLGVAAIAFLSMMIHNWKIIAGVFMLVPACAMIGYSLWIIEETPNFSLKHGKSVLLKSINRIARTNNEQQLTMEDLQFVPQPQTNMKDNNQNINTGTNLSQPAIEYSLLDLFRYKSLRYITIACAIMDLVIQFIYDGTILSLDKIGINVYLDQILVGLVEIFAAIFCSWVVVKVKRKVFLTLCLILVAIFTTLIGILTLAYEHKDNQISMHVIVEMILLGCLRFVLNSMWGFFFVYVAELFPSNILSLTFGWVSAVGTVGAFASPFIRLLTANASMFFMASLCLVGLFLLKGMKETKDQKAQQQIQQREEEKFNKKSLISQKNV